MNAGQPHWGPARDSASPGLSAGDHLDRYELLCPLAQGGMAAVWLARLHGKHGFQKLFAIKTILPQFAEDVRFQQMFLDEARIAASISHPFVAQILDLGEERGILYIVMEWVDGDSLAKLLRTVSRAQQWFPLNIAMRICADVAGALHAAHELRDSSGQPLGVVHRDVSPSNILLSSKGSPKVIDFGIAKAIGRLTQETSAGMLKGKVMYMAPEQATGRTTDRRADVWALAAVLHTILAGGEPPYTGENEMATLHRLTGGGPPNPLPTNVPREVQEIILRALHPDTEQRTPTCARLQHELEEMLIRLQMPTTAVDVAAYSAHFLAATDEARHDVVQHALEMASVRAADGASASGNGGSVSGSASGVAQKPRASSSGPPAGAAPFASPFAPPPMGAAPEASSYPNVYPSAPVVPAQATPQVTGSNPAPPFAASVYPSQSKMSAVNVPYESPSAGAGFAQTPAKTPAWVLVVGGLFALAVLATIGLTVGSRLARHAPTDDSPTHAGGATRVTPAPDPPTVTVTPPPVVTEPGTAAPVDPPPTTTAAAPDTPAADAPSTSSTSSTPSNTANRTTASPPPTSTSTTHPPKPKGNRAASPAKGPDFGF